MITFEDLLKKASEMNASDVHLTVGIPPIMRINGNLVPFGEDKFTPKEIEKCVKEILNEDQLDKYNEFGEIDLSYSLNGVGRFRINIFRQRGSSAIALRTVPLQVPTLDKLGMPQIIKDLTKKTRGLILVTGPTGSGKSTTLAAMINEINSTRSTHIITLEDPIEYLHKHKKSIVNQREIGYDTKSYASALRASLREDPDIILIGDIRDLETISIALTAAETGHLVLSTLYTMGASKSIDRIVDVFPPYQQQHIRIQLAAVLEGVIYQQLIPKADGNGRVAALETMIATPAIKNLIREGKTYQIDSTIQTGGKYGMKTMDMSLVELYKSGVINYDDAMAYAVDRDIMSRMINL
ncbi:MAG TPA: type IV pili twitching motility protein PilT [Clostridiaceae bacterium]|jgi:twitching motility protein PilT|nr:type IV pili twitching motility protein PilT [Clostridiaceae bacterium]HBF76828.1 type IV pili twitching motility protein PilT [Clostridiaceae bacterium]HBN29546.1 type IV pili twitching motility protein PilT [Clostridiaceae bacterium]HBX48596.1 type IV pili twitching motility protein PilT [Clostridiaceae bacterium]